MKGSKKEVAQINVLEAYRSEREQLIDLYMDSGNLYVLETLINKYGNMILLDLDIKGYKMLSEMIMYKNAYNLFYIIDKPKKLRVFVDYIIDRFLTENIDESEEGDFIDSVLTFIEQVDWAAGNVNKALIKERLTFFLRLVKEEKINQSRNINYSKDLMEAMVKNSSIPIPLLIQMIPEIPEISTVILENLHWKLDRRSDIFSIVSVIGSVRDALLNSGASTNEAIDVKGLMNKGIDGFLLDGDVQSLFMNIFVSVNAIASHVIEYRKEEFKLFMERFTIAMKPYKDDANWYIENYAETEGIFPLGPINDEISDESATGLAYALYHGNTIRDYHIAASDRYLMTAIDQVEKAFQLYVYMEILPENWLESDDLYNTIIQDTSSGTVESVTTEFDISELLEGFE